MTGDPNGWHDDQSEAWRTALARLITRKARGRFDRQLAEAAGTGPDGRPRLSTQRVNQLRLGEPMVNMPTTEILRGLTEALPATDLEVVLSAAEAVGFDVGKERSALVDGMPPGTKLLDRHPVLVAAVHDMIGQMIAMARQADDVESSNHRG